MTTVPISDEKRCLHEQFAADVNVNRVLDSRDLDAPPDMTKYPVRFQADVRIECATCKEKFRFIGLPFGVDMNGAAVSVDGCEGRFTIAPGREVLTELEGTPIGFTVRKVAT